MTDRMSKCYDQLVEQYLGLESMEVTETLLELCRLTPLIAAIETSTVREERR